MTPHRTPRTVRLVTLLALALAAHVFAQQRNPSGVPAPRLWQVSPAGGKAGTSFEITLAGRSIEGPTALLFSHDGIKAELVVPAEPKPDDKPKDKKQPPRPRPGMNLPAGELVKFKVTVAANVPLGHHDVRLVNKWGVSNPRTFVVGDLAEVNEAEPNNDADKRQTVELNTTINGTFAAPTDVDYFSFPAKKGQRVVISCLASGIDSRAQPAVEVYDKDDNQLAANRNYRDQDAVCDFTAAADGDYTVRLFQFTHTFRQPFPGGMPPGSSDHFYRLTISTAPWIDAVYPPVVEPGKLTKVTVYGRNLPGGKLDPSAKLDDHALEVVTADVNAPADGRGQLRFSGHVGPPLAMLDGFELRLKNAAGSSNPFFLHLARAPVTLEAGNDTPEAAQEVKLPCEIAGRVEKRRDRDWYSFTAKRGETFTIEVFSNRLGAPTYMMMVLRGAANKAELHESPLNENMQTVSRKFYWRSEDPPAYRFTAPADGKYQLLIASRAGDSLFGPRHTYHVRITKPEPTFALAALSAEIATPDAATVPAGGQAGLTIVAMRPEGFTEDIALTVEGLPEGVSCPPQTLAAGARQTTLVFSADADAADWTGEVRVKGKATVGGKEVVVAARPASLVWPMQPNANQLHLARLDRALMLSVRGKAPFTLSTKLDKAELTQGERAVLTVTLNRLWPDLKGPVQVSLMQPNFRPGEELPQGLRVNNNQPLNLAGSQADSKLNVIVGNDVPPGTYNIVLRGQTAMNYKESAKAKARANTFVTAVSVPVSLTVLPRTLSTVTLSTANATVKVGGEAAVTVRLRRQYNHGGAYKVQLVLPPAIKGLECDEVTLGPDQDEVTLKVRAPEDSKPGNRAGLFVRVTTTFRGKPVTQEAKLNVNVVK